MANSILPPFTSWLKYLHHPHRTVLENQNQLPQKATIHRLLILRSLMSPYIGKKSRDLVRHQSVITRLTPEPEVSLAILAPMCHWRVLWEIQCWFSPDLQKPRPVLGKRAATTFTRALLGNRTRPYRIRPSDLWTEEKFYKSPSWQNWQELFSQAKTWLPNEMWSPVALSLCALLLFGALVAGVAGTRLHHFRVIRTWAIKQNADPIEGALMHRA